MTRARESNSTSTLNANSSPVIDLPFAERCPARCWDVGPRQGAALIGVVDLEPEMSDETVTSKLRRRST